MNIFPNFRRTLWIGTIKRVNNERMCCPVGFSKELIPVFKLKCLELTQKKRKNTKFFHFSNLHLLKFRQTSWIGMFKKVNKEQIVCPGVFYEQIILIF